MNASCWICGSEYENSWHVCPLDKAIVSILREHNAHITSEFNRCANSSAGSTGDPEGFLRPIPRLSPTEPTTPVTGPEPSVLHIEDTWWKHQDGNPNWINQWDHDDENTDPKSWK